MRVGRGERESGMSDRCGALDVASRAWALSCRGLGTRERIAGGLGVCAPHPEALALTEQRMRGECADVVGVRSALHPTAPHGLYLMLRQRFRVGG